MAHHVQDCHWSVPTLLMPRPYWFSAWDSPWSCWNDHDVKVLPSTDRCQNCPMFRERALSAEHYDDVQPKGAIGLNLIS